MSSRADKAQKSQKDKHHAILRELVQEPANKTCAECLAKGPRWSSWSLGVFVCIRCAGIHRNLGVHISKMKSIDLDSWTPEQLQNVLRWGNKRAAEYFECYLPKDFSRPQTNHALEAFIRNKYEKKLYIKKDGEPPENPQSKIDRLKNDSKEEKDKEKKTTSATSRQRRAEKKPAEVQKPASSSNTILNMAAKTDANKLSPAAAKTLSADQHQKSHSMNDLLSLDNPGPQVPEVKHSASSNDLLNFGGWSDPVPTAALNASDPFGSTQASTTDPFTSTQTKTDPFSSSNTSQNSADLFTNSGTASDGNATSSAPAKSTKESILSLYGSGGGTSGMQQQQQPQMFGVPGGMYTMNNMMPQQQQQQQQIQQQGYQQQQPGYGMMNQMNQMNMQMQQMSFNQQPQQQQFMNQQNFNAYKQQQAGQMMYNTQQQQQRPMMNAQMNSYPQMQQQQNFNMMGQNTGAMNAGWSQQNMMSQQQATQQQQMFNGMSNGFAGTNTAGGGGGGGNTMNNLLWN